MYQGFRVDPTAREHTQGTEHAKIPYNIALEKNASAANQKQAIVEASIIK